MRGLPRGTGRRGPRFYRGARLGSPWLSLPIASTPWSSGSCHRGGHGEGKRRRGRRDDWPRERQHVTRRQGERREGTLRASCPSMFPIASQDRDASTSRERRSGRRGNCLGFVPVAGLRYGEVSPPLYGVAARKQPSLSALFEHSLGLRPDEERCQGTRVVPTWCRQALRSHSSAAPVKARAEGNKLGFGNGSRHRGRDNICWSLISRSQPPDARPLPSFAGRMERAHEPKPRDSLSGQETRDEPAATHRGWTSAAFSCPLPTRRDRRTQPRKTPGNPTETRASG